MAILAILAHRLWVPWLLGLFLLTGGYYTLRTGFFQLFGLPTWLRATVGTLRRRKDRPQAGLTQFQALSTALASTIGTGSIAGVATAIFFGGPGAVFWMWVSAFLSMMTGFGEKALALRYRERDPRGGFRGGPMCYMAQGMGRPGRVLAGVFSLFCVLASLGGGAMVQSNSIAASLQDALGVPPLVAGVVTAALVGAVIFGGVGRVGRVSEKLVPAMALLFLTGGAWVILAHRAALPRAFQLIWDGAFRPQAALGGYSAALAMRYGVARGVFTNEAGLGSSAIAHAAAQEGHPAQEGMWGMLEVCAATLVVCSVTALAILTSGVYDPQLALGAIAGGDVPAHMVGAPLSGAAFGTVMGRWGPVFVAVCLLLFAFTSLLGWSYYGERGLAWLLGSDRARGPFRVLFLGAVVLGSVSGVQAVWQLSDLLNGLMALPNLAALLWLSPEALRLLNDYLALQGPARVEGRSDAP